MSFFEALNKILAQHAHTRDNGRPASQRTMSQVGESLRADFKNLMKLGHKLQKPENISQNHIAVLCRFWKEHGYSNKTIQQKLSNFRKLCRWMGKGNMVKDVAYYLPDVPKQSLKVVAVAKKSKSWVGNGIDVCEKVREADSLDIRFGAMVRMALAFGLRAHETIEILPWKADRGDRLSPDKTKNGRPRDIFIHTAEQRIVLDHVKSMVKKNEHFGWTTKRDGSPADLAYSLGRWYKSMAKIGITKEISDVTGHGLRAQFAENAALIASVIPPTMGGTGGQMPKDDLDVKRAQISELLGHSRPSITSAYYGTFGRNNPPDSPDRTKIAILQAAATFPAHLIKEVVPERVSDCGRLTVEMLGAGAAVDPRIAQAMWEWVSNRHATDWLAPGPTNLIALEAAANHFIAS